MTDPIRRKIKQLLTSLFDAQTGDQVSQSLYERLDQLSKGSKPRAKLFHQSDVILITYGDMLRNNDRKPLQNLLDFYRTHLQEFINTIHILPFYPYSSDDGFSVIDYKAVNPELGTWEDIGAFRSAGCRLMFDAVINHISSKSRWFAGFLRGEEKYQDYFISVNPNIDLSLVTRPRSLPLLTPFETPEGEKYLWTTFSADQIDLNFSNPETLLDVLDVILFYIKSGANLIRLDAIAYLWKEIGTTCIHLPQTHTIIKLLRAIVDEVSPDVLLVTETNVPHEENVSYFGDGADEAHMVYQFALPPLTAHAIITGSSRYLRGWASSLEYPSPETCYFNFTASHDGIGVRPVTGILPEADLEVLLQQTQAHGGRISFKTNQDGTTSPYELNINYFDLLNNPSCDEPQTLHADRFMASQAIMLMLKGIPGIYFHSLVGSRNFEQGVEESGQARSINREKLSFGNLEQELGDFRSLRYEVFHQYRKLLKIRTRENAFHPAGGQEIIDLGDSVFALLRTSPDGSEFILAVQNVTSETQRVEIHPASFGLNQEAEWLDLISLENTSAEHGVLSINLAPYQSVWQKKLIDPFTEA